MTCQEFQNLRYRILDATGTEILAAVKHMRECRICSDETYALAATATPEEVASVMRAYGELTAKVIRSILTDPETII